MLQWLLSCQHTGNQQYLLSIMVKCNDRIKQHQIHVPEVLLLMIRQLQLWLTVLDIIVRKISDQPSGKRRHLFQNRTSVLSQYASKRIARMRYRKPVLLRLSIRPCFPDFHLSVRTGDFHRRLVSKKCVASPHLCLTGTFQHKAMAARATQSAHDLHRRIAVRIQLPANRDSSVLATICKRLNFFQ